MRFVRYVQELPSSCGPQAKHYADKFIRELDDEFRAFHEFYVVASEDEVKLGDLVDTEKIDICFRLL